MSNNKLHYKEALKKLQSNTSLTQNDIDFSSPVPIDDVLEFNKYGIKVPEHLIEYDDEAIDTSDIPEITQEDINAGKLTPVINARINVSPEVISWLKHSGIDHNELLGQLLENFYQSVKILSQKKVS